MEFQEVVRRRRMVRRYDVERAVPSEVVEQILENALRAPSAGFAQGFGFLVLDNQDDIARFRAAATPDEGPDKWLAANIQTPLLIVVHSNKDAYLDRYAEADKGHTDRAEDWWPVPYWDVDAGMSALLILQSAVDAGLGACFFGLPADRISVYREQFGVPDNFMPTGAVSIGYSDEPARDLSKRRKPSTDLIHRGRWSSADEKA
jgi:nitroreductase